MLSTLRTAVSRQQPISIIYLLVDSAKGRLITVILNGQKTVELYNGLFAEGPFTLQHGDGLIKWRKVAIKPL